MGHLHIRTITYCVVHFHFDFYGRLNFEDKEHCGFFVEITEVPEDLMGIHIEVDIKCNNKKAFRQLKRD